MTIAGKRVLVTGGTGSLGQVIVRRILPEAASVTVFSRDEHKQYVMMHSIPSEYFRTPNIIFRSGDIGDYHAVVGALRNCDVVIHCAAMKHVPACEKAPLQAIRTNITGAENIVRAICDLGLPVESLVFVSTDKACVPISLYGMTKAIMERVFVQANDECDTRFVGVRLVNILSSRGSVLPLFHAQIKARGPVTLTSSNMTRFVMLIEEAVDCVLRAEATAERGEIQSPKDFRSIRIYDLALALLRGNLEIGIEHTGLRPGERRTETFVDSDGSEARSNTYHLLSQDEVYDLLKANGLRVEDEPVFS